MKERIEKIFETRDYGMFKRLKGNRDITTNRVAIIKASIENIGYISNPIICNENMEIIDGQGRYEACKELEIYTGTRHFWLKR
jgi:ParB-like chromosome segregation protein Spo0J